MDARIYARLMYDLWKKGGWNWKTLVDIKSVYTRVPEEIVADKGQ